MAAPRKRPRKQRKSPEDFPKRNPLEFLKNNIAWLCFIVVALGAGMYWIIHHKQQPHRITPTAAVPAATSPAENPPPATPEPPPAPPIPKPPDKPFISVIEAPVITLPPPESQSAISADPNVYPRPATTLAEAQIEMARRCFSCGPIDGRAGAQTASALRAFQESEGLRQTGRLDDDTRGRLILTTPPLGTRIVTDADLARLQPVSPTWLGKSQQTALDYETILELVAEETHAHHNYIIQLNPKINWNNVPAGTVLNVPAINRVSPRGKAARVDIFLEAHVLQARDDSNRLMAHFPVSIARSKEKRPVGELHVTTIAPNPNYTFNPAVFPESPEAQEIGRKLIIAPGPNNPVGLAWVGLDLSGYGIHGTPDPEKVGRTESHGCFRLANWDAKTLIDLVWVGLPVVVAP